MDANNLSNVPTIRVDTRKTISDCYSGIGESEWILREVGRYNDVVQAT